MKDYTTGEVAKLIRVSSRTVCSWFDKGRIKGYSLSGVRGRRIPRENLLKFLKEHGMPQAATIEAEIETENQAKREATGV